MVFSIKLKLNKVVYIEKLIRFNNFLIRSIYAYIYLLIIRFDNVNKVFFTGPFVNVHMKPYYLIKFSSSSSVKPEKIILIKSLLFLIKPYYFFVISQCAVLPVCVGNFRFIRQAFPLSRVFTYRSLPLPGLGIPSLLGMNSESLKR
jgi:hypothetical protein